MPAHTETRTDQKICLVGQENNIYIFYVNDKVTIYFIFTEVKYYKFLRNI